jgi:hypothetical protein
LTGISITELCMSTAKAKVPIPLEVEQRILEPKLIKGQIQIKSRLEESENSLDYVKNEIKALAREASTLSAENSLRRQRRCERVQKLSDSEPAQLVPKIPYKVLVLEGFSITIREHFLLLSHPETSSFLSSIFYLLSSIFYLLSSIFYHLSFKFFLP